MVDIFQFFTAGPNLEKCVHHNFFRYFFTIGYSENIGIKLIPVRIKNLTKSLLVPICNLSKQMLFINHRHNLLQEVNNPITKVKI